MTEITFITVDEWHLVEKAFNEARAAFGEYESITFDSLTREMAKFGVAINTAIETEMPNLLDTLSKCSEKLNACQIDNRLELAVDRLGVEMKRAKLESIGGYDYRKHDRKGKRNDPRRSTRIRR